MSPSSPRLAVFQKPPSKVIGFPTRRKEERNSTRQGDERNSYEKFGEKFRSDRTIPRYLHPDFYFLPFFCPPKGQLFSFHGKNVQLCNNESTRLSFIELLRGWFLRRNLWPIWINIPRQVCCKSRFIASPFVVLGRKLRLIYLLERLC